MEEGFARKIFTPRIFMGDILYIMGNLSKIIRAYRSKEVNRMLIEKIMSVTTAVNGCVYCEWFHAKQAISSGISEEELKNIFSLQFQTDADSYEIPALLYAQHYAETNRNPDPEMTEKLNEFYGERVASYIILFIRVIYFGNLTGNTWDAVLSRLRGHPAPNSNRLFEAAFTLMMMWFMAPAMIFVGRGQASVQRNNH